VDASGDVDVDGPGGKDFGSTMFDFMNVTQVPFMIVFSFFAVFFWAGSVIGNHYLADHHTWMVIAVLIGAIVASLLITKLITQPMRRVFRKLNDFEGKLELCGKTCVLQMGLVGTTIGQADLVHGTKHLLINVRSISGASIANGSRCLVVAEDDEREDTFLVEAIEEGAGQ
jgi:ABC-type multidrug transport system fused ATPase/permease subunit